MPGRDNEVIKRKLMTNGDQNSADQEKKAGRITIASSVGLAILLVPSAWTFISPLAGIIVILLLLISFLVGVLMAAGKL